MILYVYHCPTRGLEAPARIADPGGVRQPVHQAPSRLRGSAWLTAHAACHSEAYDATAIARDFAVPRQSRVGRFVGISSCALGKIALDQLDSLLLRVRPGEPTSVLSDPEKWVTERS
jgi:hypothetical protein